MKLEKVISAGWSVLFSFGLSAASMLCMVTAYDMKVDTGLILQVCAIAAVLCSVCYSLPLGAVPVGAGALILGYLWRNGALEAGLEAVLNRLSRQFNLAYRWDIIRWSLRTADEMEPTMVTLLCVLGGVIAMLVAWSVCRSRPAFPALLVSLLCVGSCFIVTDTVPETPWLFLLLFSALMLLLTGPTRGQDAKQGNRLSLLATPAAALALLVLFAAIPKDTYAGQDNAKKMVETILGSDPVQLLMGHIDNVGNAIAESNTVDLRSVGYRITGRSQVMQVTAPFTGTVYLRSKAMDTYDGISWTDSGDRYALLNWPNYQLDDVGELSITTRFAHQMLYMPYYVNITQLRGVTSGIRNEKNLTQYSFACRRLEDPDYLAKMYNSPYSGQSELSWEQIDQHIHLTPQMREWASRVVVKITDGIINPYHKAQAIASYVRNSASYDTETPRMPGTEDNFVKWFLDESDTGYCIHFATATTVLLQAIGIPARYVTGYMVQVTEGEATPVLASQAHAWAEYWLPGFGWTVLESTPAELRQEQQSPAATAGQTQEQTQPTEAPSVETQEQNTPEKPTEPNQQTDSGKQTVDLSWLLPVVLYTVGGAVLIAAIVGQRRLRLLLRQRRKDRADANTRALLCWQETVRLARLTGQTPDQALFSLAQMAKFSQHTVTPAQLAQFEANRQQAVQTLKKRNIFCRLYYCLILAVY